MRKLLDRSIGLLLQGSANPGMSKRLLYRLIAILLILFMSFTSVLFFPIACFIWFVTYPIDRQTPGLAPLRIEPVVRGTPIEVTPAAGHDLTGQVLDAESGELLAERTLEAQAMGQANAQAADPAAAEFRDVR